MRVHGFILFAFLASSIAPSAHAEADPRAEARAHYERGIALAERRSYDEALVEFRRAYDQSPHFAVLYNIGLCHLGLDRSTEALDAFRRYLAEGGAEVPPDRRVQVETQIAELESRFAELTITADRPGTVVAIDGKELGRTPLARPIRVPPGAHDISATLDGVPVLNRRIELAAAERRTIDVAFAPATVPAAPPSPASAAPPPLALEPPGREKPDEFGPL
ncbi:MAG TPA: tetratricopeptide repeat protein, partial [Polyangiaceae bacterium]